MKSRVFVAALALLIPNLSRAIQSEDATRIRDGVEREQRQREQMQQQRRALIGQEAELKARLIVAKNSGKLPGQGPCDVCLSQGKKCGVELNPKANVCTRVYYKVDCAIEKMKEKDQQQILNCWQVENAMVVHELTSRLHETQNEIKDLTTTLGEKPENVVENKENKTVALPPPSANAGAAPDGNHPGGLSR